MTLPRRPDTIDPRVVLRTYAWIALGAGLLIYAWPADLLPHAALYGATPQGPWAIVRVGAALVVGTGYGASCLAAIADPQGSRRALSALAVGHLLFGVLFFVQWYALLDGVLSSLVG